MGILRVKRKSGRTVYHEWDYSVQESKVILLDNIDNTSLNTKNVEKIWINPNLSLGANSSVVNYFFNNYEIDTTGTIVNIDPFSEFYNREKIPTLRKDLYYVNLERVYEYNVGSRTRYAYYKQQYPVALLVATNFLENPDPKRFKYIEFLSGNRSDHSLVNLSWSDKKNKKTLKILK